MRDYWTSKQKEIDIFLLRENKTNKLFVGDRDSEQLTAYNDLNKIQQQVLWRRNLIHFGNGPNYFKRFIMATILYI